ncbi:MAG: hypothetical protein JXN65_07050 [Clostridia bacterium]|nr:hypothetical protein [Clostridia bacterium]
MKKSIVSFIILVLLFTLFVPSASAGGSEDADVEPDSVDSVYITSAYSTINIVGGSAYAYNSISCSGSINKIVISCYIQQYNGGWQTVSHWTDTRYSNSATTSHSCNVSSGYTYRVYTYFYAYIGSTLVESTTSTDSGYY